MVFILSVDKFQSRIIRDYVSALLHGSENFRALIQRETAEEIELRNGVTIAIKAASFRSLRGFELLAVLADEIAFWRDLETGANPAAEILRSVRPGLARTNGLLLALSTLYSKSGVLWEQYKANWGKPGGPLVWKAASATMNPTLDPEMIQREIEKDPEAARAEWLAEARSDVSALIPIELIEAATVPGRTALPKVEGVEYVGFVDAAGGTGKDSMTMALSHREPDGKAILDVLVERHPPFSPESVVREFSDTLKGFGVSHVEADRYAGEWVRESFRKQGIRLQNSERTKSEIYLEFFPPLTSGAVELLDNKRLAAQLASLERKTRSGGRDSVDVFYGHDDCANAACGSLVLCSKVHIRDEWQLGVFKREISQKEQLDKETREWLLGKPPKKPEEPHEQTDEEYLAEIEAEARAELEAEAKQKPSTGRTYHGW